MCYDLNEFNTRLTVDPNHAIPVFAFLWGFVHCLVISVKGSPNQVTLKHLWTSTVTGLLNGLTKASRAKSFRHFLICLHDLWLDAEFQVPHPKQEHNNLYHTDSYKTPIIPYMQVSYNTSPCYCSLSGHSHLLPSRVVENREDMVFISWAKFCLQRRKYARGLQVQ